MRTSSVDLVVVMVLVLVVVLLLVLLLRGVVDVSSNKYDSTRVEIVLETIDDKDNVLATSHESSNNPCTMEVEPLAYTRPWQKIS